MCSLRGSVCRMFSIKLRGCVWQGNGMLRMQLRLVQLSPYRLLPPKRKLLGAKH